MKHCEFENEAGLSWRDEWFIIWAGSLIINVEISQTLSVIWITWGLNACEWKVNYKHIAKTLVMEVEL